MKPGKIIISGERLNGRIKELGQEITADYLGRELVLVGILKGALIFLADLARAISVPLQFDYMVVSSYGAGTETTGAVKILKDLDADLNGRHVLIVDDIIDTGLTLKYLLENIQARQPASLRICTLLDKPSRRRVDISPDYRGFTIDSEFVVGYGLDYNQYYRELPYIAVMEE